MNISWKNVGLHVLIFAAVFILQRTNQALFYQLHTSPAVLLTSVGFGLAAVFNIGNSALIPFTAGWYLAMVASPANYEWPVIALGTLGYCFQIWLGAAALKRLGFEGSMGKTRSSIILLGLAGVITLIGPASTTSAQYFFGHLPVSIWLSISRSWAGGVFSTIVFTPLITTWSNRPKRNSQVSYSETFAALLFLVLMVYVTYWTTLPKDNVFFILYFLFGALFWIGLRMQPRIMATALFIVAYFGAAGSVLGHTVPNQLNQQLFADELFVILIAPIFFILTALVEERRTNEEMANARTLELERINHKLSAEDQSKNEFLATLAHELRNPLAPVVSSLELLRMKSEETNNRDFIEIIDIAESHNSTLAHLLNDLLDITRITQRKFQLVKEVINLKTVIERSIRTVDGVYKMRRHSLKIHMPNDNIWIMADPVRMEQIIVNILTNAAKYTDVGGSIVLKAEVYADGLTIWIKDNGVGIAPEMLEKIFDPFVQVKYNFNRSAGLGIGLSLTKRLVELHDGIIKAESAGRNLGSVFIINFPKSILSGAPVVRPSLEPKANIKRTENHGPTKNILVVDDNKPAAIGLMKLLERKGHHVSAAFEGNEALEELRRSKPQVVLLDIGMPGMDGYQVAEEIRKEHGEKGPLLIAITGYGQETDKEKAQSYGFNHHLTKPVRIADIEKILTLDEAARSLI